MPRYGDDQCEECGGIRVAKSALCPRCLVKAYERVVLQITKADLRTTEMKKENKVLQGLLEDAIWYGFKQNRKVANMVRQIDELTQEIKDYNI